MELQVKLDGNLYLIVLGFKSKLMINLPPQFITVTFSEVPENLSCPEMFGKYYFEGTANLPCFISI